MTPIECALGLQLFEARGNPNSIVGRWEVDRALTNEAYKKSEITTVIFAFEQRGFVRPEQLPKYISYGGRLVEIPGLSNACVTVQVGTRDALAVLPAFFEWWKAEFSKFALSSVSTPVEVSATSVDPPPPDIGGFPFMSMTKVVGTVKVDSSDEKPLVVRLARPSDGGSQILDAASINSLGQRQYCVGGNDPFLVTEPEDKVLQAFISQPVMDGPTLTKKSTEDSAVTILKRLHKRLQQNYPNDKIAIRSTPGKGPGYYVDVRHAAPCAESAQ